MNYLSYYSLFMLFFIFINDQGKQHKMLKSDPCNRMVANYLCHYVQKKSEQFYFLSILLFIIILFTLTAKVNNAKC